MRFDPRFLKQHAKRLVTDPEVAIVELISNSSDAGANLVEIRWPRESGGKLSIQDNGTGMTHDEFVRIWETLAYNRRSEGREILFPSGNTESNSRKLYGRNGKGRFSLFCFDDEYEVDTVKDGKRSVFSVTRNSSGTDSPFTVVTKQQERVDDITAHRTSISAHTYHNHIPEERLVELIGTTFIADTSLRIHVNGRLIKMTDIVEAECHEVETPFGYIYIYVLDRSKTGRTGQQHGVAWHVNSKSVGRIEWRDPNRVVSIEVDGRTAEAKRYSFIVLADILEEFVTEDWTGFEICDETDTVLQLGGNFIQRLVSDLFTERRRSQKRKAMDKNRERLTILPESSKERVGDLVDGIQIEIPTVKQDVLNATVRVYAGMEQARTNYGLLYQLANASPDDIDTLYDILSMWSVQDAKIVLEELGKRLLLIRQLERIVDANADELHEIHPLFDRGLWIFGPEYESPYFKSNRWLSTVIRELIGDKEVEVERPQRRPDLVALEDSRLRLFSHDSFDDRGEVSGLDKVLILELKRDHLVLEDMRQAENYARAINKSGKVQSDTKILCIAVGSSLKSDTQPYQVGDNIFVEARDYPTVIAQAQARTFHLLRALEEAAGAESAALSGTNGNG